MDRQIHRQDGWIDDRSIDRQIVVKTDGCVDGWTDTDRAVLKHKTKHNKSINFIYSSQKLYMEYVVFITILCKQTDAEGCWVICSTLLSLKIKEPLTMVHDDDSNVVITFSFFFFFEISYVLSTILGVVCALCHLVTTIKL